MSGSKLQQQPCVFDLNVISYAIPTPGLEFCNRIPNEVLGQIFESLLPSTTESIGISHVCHRWRIVATDMPSLWSTLSVHTMRYPVVFEALVSRSKNHFFSLSMNLPSLHIEESPTEHQRDFRESFRILLSNITRLRGFHLISNNNSLFLIFNKLLGNAVFSQLESLHIHQVNPSAKRYTLGPLKFNPATFTTLILKNVMIDCDASCLVGLRVVHLINSSGSFLDQSRLPHATYPDIPEEPVMMNLNNLVIDGTELAMTHDEYRPSFRGSALRYLVLANIFITTEHGLGSARRLFQSTYSPRLEYLACISLDRQAFQTFIMVTSVNPQETRYSSVRTLILTNVDLEPVGHRFLQAFPLLVSFKLNDVRLKQAQQIMVYLVVQTIMPLLNFVDINGLRYPRSRSQANDPPLPSV